MRASHCATAYGEGVSDHIDDATASFLRSAADDLQRQIGSVGVIRSLALEAGQGSIIVVASVVVESQAVEARGSGESLVSAYADLRRATAERLLITMFTEVVAA
jgi:hypothetical protein